MSESPLDYDSVSQLVRGIRVESDFVDIDFCSDCGDFTQTVSVSRSEVAGGSSKRQGLADWVRSKLRLVVKSPEQNQTVPDQEMRQYVLRAFEEVRPRLRYLQGRWVRAVKEEHPGECFDRQLRANPIVEKYDVEVLIRVMLEVSRSDSDLRTEEKAFLEEIVSDEQTLLRLSKAPKITVAELAETSSVAVKETILMLAWAMAYADGHLDVQEMARLNQLCRGFMLPEKRVRELQLAAKLFLLDRHVQNLRESGQPALLRAQFESKAQEWGLDDQQLQTLRSWYPKELASPEA